MPKEVIKLTNLNGMAPATNGGSLPISVSGIRADSIGGVVVPETIDSVDDIEATIGSDASAVGADYFVYSDYDGIMNVDNEGSTTTLGAFVPTEIDQVGDLVSLNKDIASYPQIISFKKPYCNDPIVQRPDIIMEEDKISAPGDMGHIKRIIPLNDNMSLVLVHGGQKLKIVFLAESTIDAVVYAKGDVLETEPLTFGYIVDLCADYVETVGNACAYTSVYYIDSSSVDSAKFVRTIDISDWFTDGETFDFTKFIVANFTALGRQVYGVELATDKVPTGAQVASIAVTDTKVFIGCSVPSDGITYSDGAWTYEIPEEKDLLFSIDKSEITDSALYATATFNGLEEVASGVVPLHSSMLPFMPYRHDKTNVSKGTAPSNLPGPIGAMVPYGFPIDEIVTEFGNRHNNRLWPVSGDGMGYPVGGSVNTFSYKIPGEAGIATTDRIDEQTLSITGELVVMSYADDMCGIYVSCNKPIVIPYDRDTDGYGNAQNNSRLYWVERDSSNNYFNGKLHSGAGLIGITLSYSMLQGLIAAVNVRAYNNWNVQDSYAHTDPPEKLAILMWDGEQPRNSDDTEYEGEEYTFDVDFRIMGSGTFETTPTYPYGYNDGGITWWIADSSSFPDIAWKKKKHFDTTIHAADVGVRAVVLVDNSAGEEESPETIKTTYFDPEISTLEPVSMIARNDSTMVYHSVNPAVIATPDTSGAVYPIHGDYIRDEGVSPEESTIWPIALASNPDHTMFQYVTDDYMLTTADMTEGAAVYQNLPEITVDDGSATSILSLKGILSAESSEATASGLEAYAVRYKYSLTYDGFQEGPLSYFFVDAPRVNNDGYKPFTVAVTVAIPGTIGKLISNRVTGINIYAAQIENMQEIELYKLVDSIILDKYIFPSSTKIDAYNKVITDSGNRGASFESNSGYSETYETISLKRSCQCEFNGTLFVGNIEVLDSNFKMYTGNTVVKSLPGQPSVFDYSRDFAIMPFSPIVMRGHNNRLYVFGKNKYSIVNPDTMAVEHTSPVVGCEHKGHIVANEYGVFVYYRNKVYHVNGMEVTDIGKPIATTTTDIVTLADVDGNARLIFCQSRKALVLVFSDSSYTLHVFLYGLDDGNWVYYDISAESLVFGAYERDGEAIILCADADTSTEQSLKLFGGATNRSIELEWILDLAEDGHKSTIYDVRAYEDSDETIVDVYFDDVLFTEPYNGITKTKTRMKIVNSTRPEPGVVNNGMNNIKMIVRRYVAK